MAEEKGNFNFAKIDGKACQISAGGKDYFAAVNKNGFLFQKSGSDSGWTKTAGSSGQSIAVGDDGAMWYCQRDGDIFTKKWGDGRWRTVEGECQQIDCGSEDHVVCAQKDGDIYLRDDERWTKLSGQADQVAIGSDGELWAINKKKIYKYDGRRNKWKQMPGRGTKVSVGHGGNVVLLKGTKLFSWNGRSWEKCDDVVNNIKWVSAASDGTLAAAQRDDDLYVHMENSWQELPQNGKFKHIATGGDQTVMAINQSNNIFVLTPEKKWKKFPGKALHGDIGDDGELWIIGLNQTIHRWAQNSWKKQPGKANKVFVGSSDYIACLQADGDLYEWSKNKWKKIGEDFCDAAVGCDGEMWAIQKGGRAVFRRTDDVQTEWKKYHSNGEITHISVGDEDSILCVRNHKIVLRKEWSEHQKGPHGKWWEKWSDACSRGDGGDTLNIGPDGTCVRIDQTGTALLLWGEDDPDSSDSEDEAKDVWDLSDEESLGTVRVSVRVKPPANYEARRRACVRRTERSRRRARRAAKEMDEDIDDAIDQIDRTQRAVNREVDRAERAATKTVKTVDNEARKAARKAKRAKRAKKKLQRELRKKREVSLTIGLSF